jgi:hypothetical protein
VANAVELAEKIAAIKESVTEMSGRFASSKGQAEQMVALLSAVGIEGAAQRFQGVVDACEEAEGGRTTLEGGLEKARWQVLSAVHGNMGSGAQRAGKGSESAPKGSGGEPGSGPPPSEPPLSSAAPAADLETRSGDRVEPWEGAPQPPAILEFEDEDDDFDRVMRKADDLSDGAKNITDSLDNIVKGLDRGPASSDLRTITIRDDDVVSTAIPQTPSTFSKGSLTAAVAVLGIGAVYTGKKIANRLRRQDG